MMPMTYDANDVVDGLPNDICHLNHDLIFIFWLSSLVNVVRMRLDFIVHTHTHTEKNSLIKIVTNSQYLDKNHILIAIANKTFEWIMRSHLDIESWSILHFVIVTVIRCLLTFQLNSAFRRQPLSRTHWKWNKRGEKKSVNQSGVRPVADIKRVRCDVCWVCWVCCVCACI